ncbi:MAG TPA: HAMP domain-containing sensor histidine kinase [Thermoanaerobaculia bacterium]|nr:HAMP domain-containing sensor histidine kinase [Thermoanaerobaculia bacterium]
MQHRDEPLHYAIPAGIGVIALIALAILPLVMNSRTNELRREVEEIAQPARNHLNDINYLLSVQISSLSRAAATRRAEYVADYREAAEARRREMGPLAVLSERLGPNVAARYAALDAHITRWERSVNRYLEAQPEDAAAVLEAMAAREATYANVIQDLQALDAAMTEFETRTARELRRLVRIETRLAFGLAGLALIAAATVVWLQWRLRRLAVRLSREVRARDEILGIVSHDLRSPLTAISLGAQMLAVHADDSRREYVENIQSTTRHMQRLIADLLDAAKIEDSGLSIHPVPLDPAAAVREAVSGHALLAAEKEIELQQSCESDLPKVNADHDRLLQALTNLIGNALKFTPAGGRVMVRARRDERGVVFSVEDTGAGIAPSDFPHLFEPFWQAKKTAHLGAGLGLKITRGIVEAHGGTIQAMNLAGGGACFVFTIPAAH